MSISALAMQNCSIDCVQQQVVKNEDRNLSCFVSNLSARLLSWIRSY
jgi:hypothetical protein